MERLRRFLKRSWAEKGLLFQVALMLGGIRIGLSLFPFKTVRRFLAWSSKKPVGSPVDKATYYERVIWAVNAVGRRMLGDKPCLPQALVAQWLLRRRGYAAALHIGVAKDTNGELLAHAWVESEGAITIGGHFSPEVYTPLQGTEESHL